MILLGRATALVRHISLRPSAMVLVDLSLAISSKLMTGYERDGGGSPLPPPRPSEPALMSIILGPHRLPLVRLPCRCSCLQACIGIPECEGV